jgi:mannitol/fructose-specific phosphotransferase system IIA component (Ntr-type)
MKISIGNKKEKNIQEIIEKNIQNGYVVYTDDNEFFVDVLADGPTYVATDIAINEVLDELNKQS